MSSDTEQYPRICLSDIFGADGPWSARLFPQIRPSSNHVVLYQLHTVSREKPPLPYRSYHQDWDKWDDYHVRMPHSKYNYYAKEGILSMGQTASRWVLIKKSLEKMLEKKIIDSSALMATILKYNIKFKHVWKFEALHMYFNKHLQKSEKEEFFKHTLPGIVQLALQLPHLIQVPMPLLKQNKCESLSLSQEQIASLLANAFLCTFPRRNTAYQNTAYAKLPKINFASLYDSHDESVFQKLRCICHYFRRVCSKPPTGVVTFSRRFVPSSSCPGWEDSSISIRSVPVYVDSNLNIEDATGLIQVDFANKIPGYFIPIKKMPLDAVGAVRAVALADAGYSQYRIVQMLAVPRTTVRDAIRVFSGDWFLGGGVLKSGLVQEEIRFLICPELIASMIFTESLGTQEALMVIGCERYSNYEGYGRETFRWMGNHHDTTPTDPSGRRRCAVLAIDAEQYWEPYRQFQRHKIERELNKAWIGFSFFEGKSKMQYPGVATGNWGCGAFNGAPQLKCLIQMMAAAVAKRPLAYYTFGDQELQREVATAYDLCRKHDVSVGTLFKCLVEYDNSMDLHFFFKEKLKQKLAQYRSDEQINVQSRAENKRHRLQDLLHGIDYEPQKAGPSKGSDNHSQNLFNETPHHENIQHNTSANHADQHSRQYYDPTHGNVQGASLNNYSQRPQDIPEKYRNRNYSHKPSSSGNYNAPSRTIAYNRNCTQFSVPTVSYSDTLKGTAKQRREHDSREIYFAMRNDAAFAVTHTAAAGTAGPDQGKAPTEKLPTAEFIKQSTSSVLEATCNFKD